MKSCATPPDNWPMASIFATAAIVPPACWLGDVAGVENNLPFRAIITDVPPDGLNEPPRPIPMFEPHGQRNQHSGLLHRAPQRLPGFGHIIGMHVAEGALPDHFVGRISRDALGGRALDTGSQLRDSSR